ncbi:MAG TPA: biotin/lipoyl-binding protein [Dyella sp.]|uniref:biotin/lipoyl-binding protein n=1 Tax=Dyella sp. TaxID=1869338 RepID=UPI002B7215DF|nr:biotin/lipoyl-binding protein [Dyella sp.]HTV86632.1 biotin/lipoyl-binding protein [Dyella sp.]
MLREVRATGTLVPREIRWLAAATPAQVEKILVWPGTPVQPGTVLMQLSDPQAEDALRNAQAAARTWKPPCPMAAYACAGATTTGGP